MKDNLTKTLGGIALVVASAAGTYTINEAQIGAIQTQLDDKTAQVEVIQNEKILAGKDYIYSQLTSDRLPNLSGALSTEELTQAYINTFVELGGDPKTLVDGTDISVEIKKIAATKGDMLVCTKPK